MSVAKQQREIDGLKNLLKQAVDRINELMPEEEPLTDEELFG